MNGQFIINHIKDNQAYLMIDLKLDGMSSAYLEMSVFPKAFRAAYDSLKSVNIMPDYESIRSILGNDEMQEALGKSINNSDLLVFHTKAPVISTKEDYFRTIHLEGTVYTSKDKLEERLKNAGFTDMMPTNKP